MQEPEIPHNYEISLFTQSVYAHTLRQKLCERLGDRCITIWNTLRRLDRIKAETHKAPLQDTETSEAPLQ